MEIKRDYYLQKLVDNDMYYIILDEIQLVPNFEKVLNGLLRLPNVDIYVTGSNSKFLSSDIVTEFRGRGDEIRVYPLSFAEFYSVYNGTVEDAWKEYFTYGGLPLVLYQKSDEDKSNYLSYLENAFIIEKSKRYNIKGKKYIDTPQKYYFTDSGIRNSFINFRQQKENHIMENIIYIELRRRGFNVDIWVVDIREGNEKKQLEIDFIANKGNNRFYIQSALNVATPEKRIQEEKSLVNVNDFFKKIIIVKDNIKRWRDENGIVIMGITDFLLDMNSLNY